MIEKNTKKRLVTSTFLILLILFIFNFLYFLVFTLLIVGTLSLIEFFSITKKIFKDKIYHFLFNTIFALYISVFCLLFFYFSNFFQSKVILFILLIGCVGSDIGGFIIGRLFKGPKLTKISPNKTISGAIGSFIFTIIIISTSFFYYVSYINLSIILTSFFTSLASQLGDLFFSYLKRKAKIKDTGNFLPGHGGVLDRIDGILMGIPIGFLILIITI